MITDAELRRRASDAHNLLNNPVFRDALAEMESDALEELLAIKAAWPWADRKRRMLVDHIKTIRALQQRLEIAVQAGLHAAEMARRSA